ncbi:hypothetical protein NYO99_01845 [Pelomonas sp. UHG3]|uniref:Uncharacterized protein n=1 Tax=Roseateles hydrophilus TaxID=2975054 RepID=A0ACC6C5M6_9BURK|nr:hypothetical protein [Pelomonas sp. UHG3]MCY4743711.1 hypothetical protein [Pelomonas sp. UHG3]
MPTVTQSFPPTQAIDPPTSARARVLEGGTLTGTPASASPAPKAGVPIAAARPRPASGPRAQGAPTAQDGLPGWAKGVVIGGLLLAIAMPATVLLSRSMLVQDALAAQSNSKAALLCTGGEGRALDDSSLLSWLFGGSYFACGEWETRDARVQRERDRDQANFLARERARQQPR